VKVIEARRLAAARVSVGREIVVVIIVVIVAMRTVAAMASAAVATERAGVAPYVV